MSPSTKCSFPADSPEKAKASAAVYKRSNHYRDDSNAETESDLESLPVQDTQRWRHRWTVPRRLQCLTKGRRPVILWTALVAFSILVAAAVLTWFAMINTLISRLSPQIPHNGLEKILKSWSAPGDAQKMSPWPKDFSRAINPVGCHSHNDYWRNVPLFSALAAGCVSVEADIWLENASEELQVGHDTRHLSSDRTLKTLYIDPLIYILDHQNQNESSGNMVGVFDASPNTTLVLLIDFKNDGGETWPLLQKHLQPLRERRWLTRWNATSQRRDSSLITVVGTGNAPFDLIATSSNKDVFFDAPLEMIGSNRNYTAENSYFASVDMKKAIGKVGRDLNERQLSVIDEEVQLAKEKGLVSRYWGTPSWPLSRRNRIWETLVEHRVGILNVDSLETATRWDWRWCTVAGLPLCG